MTWPTTRQAPSQAACPAGPTRSGSAYLRPSRVIQLALERPHLWRVRSATCRDAAQRRMDSAGVADARGPSHRDLESVCGPRPRLGGLLGVMSEFGGPPPDLGGFCPVHPGTTELSPPSCSYRAVPRTCPPTSTGSASCAPPRSVIHVATEFSAQAVGTEIDVSVATDGGKVLRVVFAKLCVTKGTHDQTCQ